jgi:hypothetical protein
VTDETYKRIVDFVRRNSVESAVLGALGRIPIFVDADVPDDEPELSEEPYAVALRLSPADHLDLKRRVEEGRDVL